MSPLMECQKSMAMGWISVWDKKPEILKDVLLWGPTGFIGEGYYFYLDWSDTEEGYVDPEPEERWLIKRDESGVNLEVTHWMYTSEIPAPSPLPPSTPNN